MKVSAAKTQTRIERNVYLTSKHIKSYGQDNDYPQKVLEIVGSSGTGKVCVNIHVKFVNGNGFVDTTLNDAVLNDRQEKGSSLLRKFAKDFVNFYGFACLVKYDGLGQPVEYYNIPFEHCRIEIDKNKKYTGRISVYPDWTNITGISFKKDEVVTLNRYNPATVIDEMAAAGGPKLYKGQIYYFTGDGDLEYPVSPFDPVVTDMLTEESVSTVKHRNAKFNFLPSGILVRKGIKPITTAEGSIDRESEYNKEQEESAQEIKRMQGDENTSKIWVVDVDADEEAPEFIPFDAKNYDKQYEYTEGTVQDNIGRMFMVPPILRGVDIGAGFGATLMQEAYDYMNSVTTDERNMLASVFADITKYYSVAFTDFEIEPLEYISTGKKVDKDMLTDLTKNERRELIGYEPSKEATSNEVLLVETLGVGGTQSLIGIVSNPELTSDQKTKLLVKLFAFTEEEAINIIGGIEE